MDDSAKLSGAKDIRAQRERRLDLRRSRLIAHTRLMARTRQRIGG
jgi:hypothetical protein